MIISQREKLEARESEYLSIGVTSNGVPRSSVGVPWIADSYAFNMRIPDVYISPEDIKDAEIMNLIESYRVIGFYSWAPLEDYSFLARFKNLQDINIMNGDSLRDIDFLSGLHECRMLYLQNAKLKDLNVIVDVKNKSSAMFGCLWCIGLDNCTVEDISVFEREKVRFSEFLVWKPEGSNEKERWNIISARTRKYYEFKE